MEDDCRNMKGEDVRGQEVLTPMMRQYRRVKGEIDGDVILMFRLGDFYEMFFEDAVAAAPVLGVTLTKRSGYPMCGIPYHALDSYLAKLIRANRKIAICDQMEAAGATKGIVRREVTRIVTPGTVTEEEVLVADQHSFLAAVCCQKGALVSSVVSCQLSVASSNGLPPAVKSLKTGNWKLETSDTFGVAVLDLSTGTFLVEEHGSAAGVRDALRRYAVKECLASDEGAEAVEAALAEAGVACVSRVEAWRWEYDTARDALLRHFGVASLDGFGCEGKVGVTGAAGALLFQVREKLRRSVEHIRSLRLCSQRGTLQLDAATCAHLDLLPERGKTETLYKVLNATCTPMGARRLQGWILQPLCDVAAIRRRHEAVAAFIRNRSALGEARQELKEVRDMERLIAKVSLGRGNARDLLGIASGLKRVPALREAVEEGLSCKQLSTGLNSGNASGGNTFFEGVLRALMPMPGLVERICGTLAEEPSATLADGGVIREGVNEELDSLRQLATHGREWVAQYQAQEAARTGIKSLKVKHNSVFGYYIEVSTANLGSVPEEYQRKQTTVNGERFITPELKRYEEQILGAHDKAIILETQLFEALRGEVVAETEAIQRIAEAFADIDVIATFADRALALGYVQPEMTDDDTLEIVEGRHPIVEQLPDAERFVPNDTRLNCHDEQIHVITGPNMAGKSTYIRQVAMIAVMAQIGSFVPAKSATIGCVDRVFTRVGAADDLARGRSTFMVEMQETANILNNATAKSLVVLDEIGRGTSTFDGISIAWAVAEHLHNTPDVKARTLFATHYHELTDLALTLPGVKNYCVMVREQKGGIAFLRRIVPGAADKSYGIAVAQLAGLPVPVLDRAREILANLEEGEMSEGEVSLARARTPRKKTDESPDPQLELPFLIVT